MKKLLIILGALIIIIIIGIASINYSKSTVNPHSIAIVDINVSDSKIDLKGMFSFSGPLSYKGYTAEYKNEALYIKIKGGLILFPPSPSSDPGLAPVINISMKNTYGNVKKIYLQGDSVSDNILIYPKK